MSLPRRGFPKHAPLLDVGGVLQQTNWLVPTTTQKAASRSRNAGLGELQVEQVVQVEVRGPKREGKRGAQRSSEGEGEGKDKRKKWRVSAEDQMRGSRQAIVFLG